MEVMVTERCCFCGEAFTVQYWSDRAHCYRTPCLALATGRALAEAERKAQEAREAHSPLLRRLSQTSAKAAEFRAFRMRIEYHNSQVTATLPHHVA